MTPFSAWYYIKQNKSRAVTAAIMFLLSVVLLVGGNFIMSCVWAVDESAQEADQFITAQIMTTDEDYKDWAAFYEEVCADPKLQVFASSGAGHGAMEYGSAMGITIGGNAMVFTSKAEMEEAFRIMGIDCDLTNVHDYGLVLSSMYAKSAETKGVSVGDVLDPSFSSAFDRAYTVDAIYEGNECILFYLIESEAYHDGRIYIHGKDMDRPQLKQYLKDLIGDRKVTIYEKSMRENIEEFFQIFRIVFYAVILLIGVILSVTISSWYTGHYMKRTYEFGVYRAIGRSRGEISRKIASEILLQDLLGILAGVLLALLATFLLNELVFLPSGEYLPYVSRMGVIGAIVCNLLAVVPLIFFKSKAMNRADVTEF